jgi:hypothetical protein
MFPAIVGIAFRTARNALPFWLRSLTGGTTKLALSLVLLAFPPTTPSTVAANLGMTHFLPAASFLPFRRSSLLCSSGATSRGPMWRPQ